ncbi:protein of unknown function DUF690 [Beutenbergia cavernae DSM 12333]|uniref:Type VII secretion protein EccB n=1 Tax=Beutenbergia cavernae (strain ATCC BAA-8 / DSM 12333 / CCUG 43141 / JCM 11478 / NBRC 16432 / NCIMB 13614 / HKI 0122) TaxID=471853 RepID=C5C0Q1_BEUC1|nr:type VII secretion protein EccB [Beutenbergia cavernae]ACQ81447.1 protein of unknown function DUF690 [Beutenbergia cavernae DSM 12333]
MATKKELVEAQAFSRRRLLTAFTSGAPGGRELEPAKPMRGVVAGVVLSVLVIGGSLAFGLFNRGLPEDWENGAIIVVSENGARYVSQDGVLLPVENMASARLVAPQDAPMYTVSESDLADVPRGERVGIVGAPDALPEPADLVGDRWRSCLDGNGAFLTSLDLPAEGETEADQGAEGGDGVGTLVRAGGQLVLVQGDRRYPVPESEFVGGVLRELGLDGAGAPEVDPRWLQLFDEGEPIEPFTVPGAGEPAPGAAGDVQDALVGSVLVESGTDDAFVIDDAGELAPLTPFARAMYLIGPGGERAPIEVTTNEISSIATTPEADSPVPQTWPTLTPLPVEDGAAPCALLTSGEDWSTALVAGPVPERTGVAMAPGAGALARFVADPGTTSGPVRFIDENGTMYAITGEDQTGTLARLGYATDDVAVVPYAWGDLFAAGPNLSTAAAQNSVTEIPAAGEDE